MGRNAGAIWSAMIIRMLGALAVIWDPRSTVSISMRA
jgi:hypothetical protein